ncbi:hypothetical protein WR25_18521 [Diploscapter pachys]|uniref:Uncharacterized protein n=1 Tax=Diploscapter pachys TaxID=2018661 RepID=A0A2A2JF97_9BILA|nr:hypothetical protein WR25_18521 [Diploscapter pachys]
MGGNQSISASSIIIEGDRLRENRRRQFDDVIKQSKEKRRQLQNEYDREKAELQRKWDENEAKRVNEEVTQSTLMKNRIESAEDNFNQQMKNFDAAEENERKQFEADMEEFEKLRKALEADHKDAVSGMRNSIKSAEYDRAVLMADCQAFGDRMIEGLVDIQVANNEKDRRREYNLIVQRNKENANKLEDAVRDLGRFVNNIEGKKLDEVMEANIKMKLSNIKKILSPGFGENLDHDVSLMLQRSFSVDEDVAELRRGNLEETFKNAQKIASKLRDLHSRLKRDLDLKTIRELMPELLENSKAMLESFNGLSMVNITNDAAAKAAIQAI